MSAYVGIPFFKMPHITFNFFFPVIPSGHSSSITGNLKKIKNHQLLCHVTPLAVGITRIEPASILPCAALIPIMATASDLTLHI